MPHGREINQERDSHDTKWRLSLGRGMETALAIREQKQWPPPAPEPALSIQDTARAGVQSPTLAKTAAAVSL